MGNTASTCQPPSAVGPAVRVPPTNATIADTTGVVTILDNNDPLPIMTINNSSTTEGNGTSKTMTFNVTLSAASGQQVSVGYSTAFLVNFSNPVAVTLANTQATGTMTNDD